MVHARSCYHRRPLHHIPGRHYVIFQSEGAADLIADHKTTNYVIVASCIPTQFVQSGGANFQAPSLKEIYTFDRVACCVARRNPSKKLIFCAGVNVHVRVRIVFLTACHFIMSHDVIMDDMFFLFCWIYTQNDSNSSYGHNSLVFHCLKRNLRFATRRNKREHLHYENSCNQFLQCVIQSVPAMQDAICS